MRRAELFCEAAFWRPGVPDAARADIRAALDAIGAALRPPAAPPGGTGCQPVAPDPRAELREALGLDTPAHNP